MARCPVPMRVPTITRSHFTSGAAISTSDFQTLGLFANWLIGRGSQVVPCFAIGTVAAGATVSRTVNITGRRYQTLHRVWVVSGYAASSAGAHLTFTVSPDGIGTGYLNLDPAETSFPRFGYHLQTVSSTTQDQTATITIVNDATGDAVITSVQCFEVPRLFLTGDSATEGGMDIDSYSPGQPIYRSSGSSTSLDALVTTETKLQTVPRRTGIWHWNVPDADAFTTSSTAYVSVPFLVKPQCIARQDGASDATGTVNVRVYARATTANGSVQLTNRSGSGMGAINIVKDLAFAWYPTASTGLTVDCEDISTSDGRRGGNNEELTVKVKAGTSGQIWIAAVSVGEVS